MHAHGINIFQENEAFWIDGKSAAVKRLSFGSNLRGKFIFTEWKMHVNARPENGKGKIAVCRLQHGNLTDKIVRLYKCCQWDLLEHDK